MTALKPWLRALASPHPLRDPSGSLRPPILICSAGRSGSTLLRMMLMQHAQLYLPPETNCWGRLIQKFLKYYRFLPWKTCAQYALSEFDASVSFPYWQLPLAPVYQKALRLPRDRRSLEGLIDLLYRHMMAEHKPDAHWWGEKSINNALFMREISRLYPGARFIHLIRDGRDVIASYLENGLISADFKKTCFFWAESVRSVRRAAEGAALPHVLEIRYEALVTDPGQTFEAVCGFLGLPYEPAAMDFWQAGSQPPDVAAREMHRMLMSPISASRIGTWRRRLTAEQQGLVRRYVGPFLDSLGYSD